MRQRQYSCITSIRFFAPHPWIGVLASAYGITATDGSVSGGIPPVRLPLDMSRVPDYTLHRATKAVGLKAVTSENICFLIVLLKYLLLDCISLLTSSSKPSCPLSRYRPELRTDSASEKIRPAVGSDSHSHILRLSPPISQRIGYLYPSQILRR